MWNIGNLKIDGRVVLGPMSGITTSGYRDFMKPFGVAVSVTELISDKGVVHGIHRTLDYISFEKNYPTGLQLFGNDSEFLAKAAIMAYEENPNIDFFDLNMGCPVRKIIRNGSGVALMEDPKKCGEIVRTLKDAVDVPVTAKIRLGQTENLINFREVIDDLVDAGVDAVAVHARTKKEQYSGSPHYDLVKNLQSEMSVPLIISGNIFSLKDAVTAVNVTGAEGVMVARGGVGNPYLVTQIDKYFKTGEVLPNPTVSQQIDWCIELANFIIDEKDEDTAIRRLRGLAPKFISGCFRGRGYRNKLATEIQDYDSMIKLLEEIRSKLGDEQIKTDGRLLIKDYDLDL